MDATPSVECQLDELSRPAVTAGKGIQYPLLTMPRDESPPGRLRSFVDSAGGFSEELLQPSLGTNTEGMHIDPPLCREVSHPEVSL